MVLKVASPYKHPKTGIYWVRKVVPKDVRTVIGKGELKASLKTRDPDVAKSRSRAELDRMDAIIGSARVSQAGAQRALTPREVAAIVGADYRKRLVARHDDPGDPAHWDEEQDYIDSLFTPDVDGSNGGRRSFEADRNIIAEAVSVLERSGIAGAPKETVGAVAELLAKARYGLARIMLSRADGDWSLKDGLERFPTASVARPDTPVPIADLLTAWAAESGKTGKALYDRERTVGLFTKHLGHGDAAKVTADDVVSFKEARLAAGRSAKTVANDLNELSPIWRWAKRNRKLDFAENPFAGVAPLKKPSSKRVRGPYSPEEATRLLREARGQSGLLRWLPWLLCFTGARLGEVCQATKEDFKPIAGVPGAWSLHIHENGEGRTLKTPQSERHVPLHPALISEGFLDYLASLPKGSPLFPKVGLDKFGHRKGRAGGIHARWVRDTVGITDTDKDPAHAWRHLFEDRARQAGVPQNVTDALMGHLNAANESEGYGRGFRFMPEITWSHVARMGDPAGGTATGG